jgi:hypothetical protein
MEPAFPAAGAGRARSRSASSLASAMSFSPSAPRFTAYLQRVEGRPVLHMPRSESTSAYTSTGPALINIEQLPMSRVASDATTVAHIQPHEDRLATLRRAWVCSSRNGMGTSCFITPVGFSALAPAAASCLPAGHHEKAMLSSQRGGGGRSLGPATIRTLIGGYAAGCRLRSDCPGVLHIRRGPRCAAPDPRRPSRGFSPGTPQAGRRA